MKNKLLILLLTVVLSGCTNDVIGQTYLFQSEYHYLNKLIVYSGSQSREVQANLNYCSNPATTTGAIYNRYQVFSHDAFGGSKYEGDVFVLRGESPSDESKRFVGQGGNYAYYFKRVNNQSQISAVRLNSNGEAPRNSVWEAEVNCPTGSIESNNTVVDNSNKTNLFYSNCTNPITSTYSVDIIGNRVWLVNQSIYLNGQNLYYRTEQYEWIKIDTNGYIVDTVYVNCSTGDRLVCVGTATIPVNSNSMIDVASKLGITAPKLISLELMGDVIGKYPPINFPDDFRNYKSNMYAYAAGTIVSTQGCGFTVPSTTQSQFLLWFSSDKGVLGTMDFCGGGATLSVNLGSGTTTKFVTIDFCDPPFSSKGEVRVSIRIEANGTASTRRNIISIRSDVFNMDILVTQLPGQ